MAESAKVPKRRRILDPSAIVSVPIYSNQVSNCLQMKAPVFSERKPTDEETEVDKGIWSQFSNKTKAESLVTLSDSEEEAGLGAGQGVAPSDTKPLRALSPPPPLPECLVQKPSRKATQKLNEIKRRLREMDTLLSPVDGPRKRPSRRSRRSQNKATAADNDDVVLLSSPEASPLGSPLRGPERQIPLKVRCRTDLHKIPVRPSTPLSDVVEQLSVTLGVPPTRLLLLREEAELSRDSTVAALGLGIADILECVVMAEKDTAPAADAADDIIKVRLQGNDRTMDQEFSLRRDAPLGSVFTQYSSRLSVESRGKVCFLFDGNKVSPLQTPEQLDMEDGDIIEVWA